MAKRYKLDPDRYLDGVYAGLVDGAKEFYVMTPQGVIRARSIKRKPDTMSWNEDFFKCVGLPWQPQPTQSVLADVLPYRV